MATNAIETQPVLTLLDGGEDLELKSLKELQALARAHGISPFDERGARSKVVLREMIYRASKSAPEEAPAPTTTPVPDEMPPPYPDKAATDDLAQARATIKHHAGEISKHRDQVARLQDVLTQAGAPIGTVSERVQWLIDKPINQVESLDDHLRARADAELKAADLAREIEQVRREATNYAGRVNEMRGERDAALAKIEEMKAHNGPVVTEMQRQAAEIQRLQEALFRKAEAVKARDQQIQGLAAERDGAMKRNADGAGRIADLVRDVERLGAAEIELMRELREARAEANANRRQGLAVVRLVLDLSGGPG